MGWILLGLVLVFGLPVMLVFMGVALAIWVALFVAGLVWSVVAFLFHAPVLAIVLATVLAPLLDARRSRTGQERAVSFRLTMFTWLIGLLLAGALLLVPNKQRVLMFVPIFMIAVVIGKVWRRARLRARREREVDLDRMKRVN